MVVGVGPGHHHVDAAGADGTGHRRGDGATGGGEEEGDEPGEEQDESESAAPRRAHGPGAASAPRCHSRTMALWLAKASGGSSPVAKARTSSASGQARGVPETILPA